MNESSSEPKRSRRRRRPPRSAQHKNTVSTTTVSPQPSTPTVQTTVPTAPSSPPQQSERVSTPKPSPKRSRPNPRFSSQKKQPPKETLKHQRVADKPKPQPAPTPAPKKQTVRRMFFANEANYSLASIVEDKRLTDFWIHEETRFDQGHSGNIYRGVVVNAVPALNAAFVDIGLEKHGFLPYDDYMLVQDKINKNRRSFKRKGKQIENNLKAGDVVLVQIAKEAIEEKGPMLTGKISMPGRFLIHMPYTEAVRMSRQLSQAEKKRFRTLVDNKMDPDGGLIFRTASKGRTLEDLEFDFEYLRRGWKRINHEYDEGIGPKLLYKELEFMERILRDNFAETFDEIVIDHPRLKYRISQFLKVIAPKTDAEKLIKFHTQKEQSIWKAYDLLPDIERLFSKSIRMESGGRLIIEDMETLTAIDVNSGKNVSGKSLDETILETNLEAAREIPRQLRLRQIGGIIIIDFIDMRLKRDEDKVFKVLEAELEKDRTPSDIKAFTELGIVQITRQRVGESLNKRLTYTCPTCKGSGRRPTISFE